jgi:hypothetical protein
MTPSAAGCLLSSGVGPTRSVPREGRAPELPQPPGAAHGCVGTRRRLISAGCGRRKVRATTPLRCAASMLCWQAKAVPSGMHGVSTLTLEHGTSLPCPVELSLRFAAAPAKCESARWVPGGQLWYLSAVLRRCAARLTRPPRRHRPSAEARDLALHRGSRRRAAPAAPAAVAPASRSRPPPHRTAPSVCFFEPAACGSGCAPRRRRRLIKAVSCTQPVLLQLPHLCLSSLTLLITCITCISSPPHLLLGPPPPPASLAQHGPAVRVRRRQAQPAHAALGHRRAAGDEARQAAAADARPQDER